MDFDPFSPPWWNDPTLRLQALTAIESQITSLRPTAFEAESIIESLAGELRLRYADRASEVLLRMSLLKKDLERLDNNQEVEASDVLAAYERAVERRET